MATSAERGFSFKDLPMVIDPASAVVQIKLAPYRAVEGDLGEADVAYTAYEKVTPPEAELPFTKTLGLANLYADDPDWGRAERAFAYGCDGVLRAFLYRDGTPHRGWVIEQMPEEFTGAHVACPSVRFMFASREAAQEAAALAAQLQVAQQSGVEYAGIRGDGARLLRLLMTQATEPRLVEVADPVQGRSF
jgi:hypothetical protein